MIAWKGRQINKHDPEHLHNDQSRNEQKTEKDKKSKIENQKPKTNWQTRRKDKTSPTNNTT